jgi:CheY-like chemotaxis protein
MHVLVASSSAFRQRMYRQAVESLGHQVSVVSGGVDCIAQLRQQTPDLVILEAPVFWGAAEGVLQVMQDEQRRVPVILVAAGNGSIDWFQLSRFRVSNLLFRVPTAHELSQAVANIQPQGVMRGGGGISSSEATIAR